MKKIALTMLVSAVMLGFMACGEKKAANNENDGWKEHEVEEKSDTTVFGICCDGSSMNVLQMVTDNGDTLTYATQAVQDAGMLFGGFDVGDRMAVLFDKKAGRPMMIVNETTILGEWVMPNPLDGTSVMGIRFKDGGIAESINQGSIAYKTWQLVRGLLEITSVREGGGDFEETEVFRIMYLSSDSLCLKDVKNTDGEIINEYSRPEPEDNYDDLGIKLDEGSEDDFVM